MYSTFFFFVSNWSSLFFLASHQLLCLYTTHVTDSSNNPSSDVCLLIFSHLLRVDMGSGLPGSYPALFCNLCYPGLVAIQ